MAPLRSVMMTFLRPMAIRSRMIAMPAAPAPEVTIFTSSIFLPTTLSALIRPAKVMTAVPCWSSWKIGMSQHSLSFFSISKHLGAAISSRLMPPKDPARRLTVRTISSTSCVLRHSGIASTPPKALKSTHFPSMTGMPASGPISPRPRTAVPSVITATVFHLLVSS